MIAEYVKDRGIEHARAGPRVLGRAHAEGRRLAESGGDSEGAASPKIRTAHKPQRADDGFG